MEVQWVATLGIKCVVGFLLCLTLRLRLLIINSVLLNFHLLLLKFSAIVSKHGKLPHRNATHTHGQMQRLLLKGRKFVNYVFAIKVSQSFWKLKNQQRRNVTLSSTPLSSFCSSFGLNSCIIIIIRWFVCRSAAFLLSPHHSFIHLFGSFFIP